MTHPADIDILEHRQRNSRIQDISRYPGLRDAMPAKGKPEATPATVKQGLICLQQHITIITILQLISIDVN